MTDQSLAQRDDWPGGWNPRIRLRCLRCGYDTAGGIPVGGSPVNGCPACGPAEGPAPLEVEYAPDLAAPAPEPPAPGPPAPAPGARPGLDRVLDWLAVHHQPIARSARVNLGRPVTPLVRQEALGPGIFIKNESLNPTWGHKDRLHEVAVGVARLAGARGVVASSTGNHGAAAAAHATAAGLPSVVFCHPRASGAAIQMITAYGGLAVQIEPAEARETLIRLVDDGWFPATCMDPAISGRSNPYGAEGYKTLSIEVTAQLGGLPGTVIVPTASGDTLYGIAKGFAEISELTGEPMPRIVSAQPAGADPLARSVLAGHPVTVAQPESLALSVADPMTGRHALAAMTRWGGSAVSVPEEAIADAVRRLARFGLLAEPASAVALGGLWELRNSGQKTVDGPVVLVLTSAGIKWPQALAEVFSGQPLRSTEALFRRLSTSSTVHESANV